LQVKYLIILLLLTALQKNAFADDKDSTKNKIGILPIVSYAPETRLSAGGFLYTYFKLSKLDSLTKKSNTQTYLIFTLNEQILFQNDFAIYTPGNKFYLKGRADYIHFPEFYFGIGNATQIENKCLIDFNALQISTSSYFLVKKKLYAGLLLEHQNLYMLNKTLVSYSDNREVYGGQGYSNSGVGISILLDKRNNPLNPEKGYYLETSYSTYYNHKQDRHAYSGLKIDLRWYRTFLKSIVLNTSMLSVFNQGAVPFRMMPYLGGPRYMRGYYQGRYRDNNLLVLQEEVRLPLWGRVGLALFAGVGQVSEKTEELILNRFHYNYGLGLRFKIDRKENTNIRFDWGFTEDSQGMYLVFAEAF
jgi:hypothetical protein